MTESSPSVAVLTSELGDHVSIELVDAYNEFICRELRWHPVKAIEGKRPELLDKLMRRTIFGRFVPWFASCEPCFVLLMSPHRIPRFARELARRKGPKAILAFDVWPNDFEFVEQIVRGYGVTHLFLTSRDAADALRPNLPGVSVTWFPEALVSESFEPKPLRERKIDILQMGRKYDRLHAPLAAQADLNYIYERVPGQIIYETKSELYRAMTDSKISICFTRSITHPEIAGKLATVTQRYLESMAAGCVVLGSVPGELQDLFPYEPVIKADQANIVAQVRGLLANITEYEDLVHRNREHVLAYHMLINRMPLFQDFIDQAKQKSNPTTHAR